jgi:hypothetical protein
MHGTFPERFPKRTPLPDGIDPWIRLGSSLAIASIPFALAIVVALLRFGSKATVADVVNVLVTATTAAPM